MMAVTGVRSTFLVRVVLAWVGGLLGLAAGGCQGPPAGGAGGGFWWPRIPQHAHGIKPPDPAKVWPPRAVWVVRETYQSPDEIANLMEQCQQAGFNTVLFQVRGNGTAFYRSKVEPWAEEYRQGPPAFDPLEVACLEAHRRGLACHAWVNVMPAWRGSRPPREPNQLYIAKPHWFLYDQHGQREPLPRGFYVSLNPCLPEVREYLVGVFADILERYPVDGLHLDYIRFPIEEAPKGSDYPYDEKTLALYRKASGKRPEDSKAAWSQWRTAQVTQLVRQLRAAMRRARPETRLTTSCAPDIEHARERYYQDGPTWLRERLVDLVFVMNYTGDNEVFRRRQEAWQRAAGGGLTAPGISAAIPSGKPDQVILDQLRLADKWNRGFAIFAASNLFSENPRSRQRLDAIRPVLKAMQSKTLASHLEEIGQDLGPFVSEEALGMKLDALDG